VCASDFAIPPKLLHELVGAVFGRNLLCDFWECSGVRDEADPELRHRLVVFARSARRGERSYLRSHDFDGVIGRKLAQDRPREPEVLTVIEWPFHERAFGMCHHELSQARQPALAAWVRSACGDKCSESDIAEHSLEKHGDDREVVHHE
jgi:hypothetical protein